MAAIRFRRRRADVSGFTLVERIVTIAVGAILLTLAVPAYNGFITGQRVKTASYGLYTSLLYARSEALKRNGQVYVVPNGTWTNGWIVTINNARTYAQCTDGTTEPDCLKVHAAGANVSIASAAAQVTYRWDGRTTLQGINFVLCGAEDDAGITTRTIAIDLTGRPNLTRQGDCA